MSVACAGVRGRRAKPNRRDALPGRMQDDGAPRRPPFVGEQIDRWEHVERPVVLGRVPVDVLMMRAGDHHDTLGDPRRLIPVIRDLPARVVEGRPEFVAAALQVHGAAVHRLHDDAVEVGPDGVRSGDLGHRAMKRAVPRRVL